MCDELAEGVCFRGLRHRSRHRSAGALRGKGPTDARLFTDKKMPATKAMREWLPGSLQGGAGAGSGSANAGASSGGAVATSQVTVMSRVTNAINPASARERAGDMQNMANMAGLPVGAADDSQFEQCFPKLTRKQRIQGCLGCFAVGMFISLLSFMLWWTGNTAGWALMYTTGNIVSLCGSGCVRASNAPLP